MLLKLILRIFLLTFVLNIVQSTQYEPKYCAECEEEVWEEIPCDTVHSSSTTTTSTPYIPPIVSTTAKTTTKTTKSPKIYTTSTKKSTSAPTSSNTIAPTISPPIYATIQNTSEHSMESNEGYKKCYYECKSGCKEYCRKGVLYPDTKKHIFHLSKTTETQGNGHVETKHLHERTFIPSPTSKSSPIVTQTQVIQSNPYNQQSQQQQQYEDLKEKLPQPAYVPPASLPAPVPSSSPLYSPTGNYQNPYAVNSLGFSLEEFTKVLSTGQQYSNTIPGISQINYPLPTLPSYDPPVYVPQPEPQPQPQPPQKPEPSYAPVTTASEIAATNACSGVSAQATAPQIPSTDQKYSPNAKASSSQANCSIRSPTSPLSSAYPPESSPRSVDAQTASSGGGNAAAIAISPNNYKTSYSSNSVQGDYIRPPPITNYGPTSSVLATVPSPMRYSDASTNLKILQNFDPTIDNYLREFFYSAQSSPRGYGYNL